MTKCAAGFHAAEIDLEIDETHFWSDAKIVLGHLSNTQKRFSTYVSHILTEIVSNSDSGVASHPW